METATKRGMSLFNPLLGLNTMHNAELDTDLEADWETPVERAPEPQEESRKARCDLSSGECESCG